MTNIDYSIKDIEKYVQVDGTVKNVEVSRLTAPGDNYISLVLRVDFEVEKNGHSTTLNTIAKCIPLGERKTIEFYAKAMTNEIKWYTEMVPLIMNFVEETGIDGVDFFSEYCGSRYSLDPEKKEGDKDSFLLLKNLIPEGFKNEDRQKGFNLKAAKAILKRLALFHSIPLAMKITKPKLFQVIKDYLDTSIHERPCPGNGPDQKESGPPPEDLILEKLINMPECSPYVDRLKKLKDIPKTPFMWLSKGPEPWSTILHNDFWVNNIMINPQEGKETLVKIIDFQKCSYGSYAKDLVFFLLTSVDNDVTRNYIDDLIRFYYEELTSVLKKTNVNLELTYTAFLRELHQVANDSEISHVLFLTTPVLGDRGVVDPSIEEFNPFEHFPEMINNMNQYQKDKLILIASESAHRNWI